MYQLPSRFIFTADEEYQATYAKTIVDDFHPVWIGVSAGDTGFYLGPYFTYFTAFWLKLSAGDPLITGYASAVLGSFTAVILYYLGQAIFSTQTGFFGAMFYAFSPLMVYFDQRYWNPSPVPLITCLLLLALIKLKDNGWWLVVVSFCLGAIWHVHLSLVPSYLLAIWAIWRMRSRLPVKTWLLSLAVMGMMLLPLVIFDYNHAWSNILTPVRLLQSGGRSLALSSHIGKLGETLARFTYLTPGLTNDGELRNSCQTGSTTPSFLLILLICLPLLIYLLQKQSWQDYRRQILTFAFLLLCLSFITYPGPISAYYALGLIPLYFLIISSIIGRFNWPFLMVFVILSVRTLSMTDNSYGLSAKRILIQQVMTIVKSDTYTLREAGDCHKYAGWRYLFLSSGRPPSTSSTDSALGWLYPREIGSPGKYLVVVGATPEVSPIPSALAVIGSGGYTAYITLNQNP